MQNIRSQLGHFTCREYTFQPNEIKFKTLFPKIMTHLKRILQLYQPYYTVA